MAAVSFMEGNKVVVEFTFKQGDVLVDPANVFLVVFPGRDQKITYQYLVDPQLTKVSEGRYRAVLDLTVSGLWRGECYSTGATKAAAGFSFTVVPRLGP